MLARSEGRRAGADDSSERTGRPILRKQYGRAVRDGGWVVRRHQRKEAREVQYSTGTSRPRRAGGPSRPGCPDHPSAVPGACGSRRPVPARGTRGTYPPRGTRRAHRPRCSRRAGLSRNSDGARDALSALRTCGAHRTRGAHGTCGAGAPQGRRDLANRPILRPYGEHERRRCSVSRSARPAGDPEEPTRHR